MKKINIITIVIATAVLMLPSFNGVYARGGGGGHGTVNARYDPNMFDANSMAHYASGTPYVPFTGPAMLHQGEAVIPAGQNAGGHTFNITVNAMDTSGIRAAIPEIARQLNLALVQGGGKGLVGVGAARSGL